jgi:predicted metalloprotease with PDZ domain
MLPAPAVTYRVRVLPEAHELDVELSLTGLAPGPLTLATPTWVPGAYGFMKYGRDLFDVRAFDPATDRPVPVVRSGWSGFTVVPASDRLVVRWRAYAFDPAWGELAGVVDHRQAVLLATRYLHAPALPGPCRVRYELPEDWALHHPAGAREVDPHTWDYPTFAVLLDTPVVAGAFEVVTTTVRGVPFELVFLDRAVAFDAELPRFIASVERIAEGCHAVFGRFPFERYTFVFTFNPTSHWGLEHANATMIALDPLTFIDAKYWFDAMRVTAHELFHAWNVCRLKPAPLGRPDHEQGSFPDALWVAEGFTRWYEFLLAARAGEAPGETVLSNVVNYWRHLAALPAFARVSPTDSSRATFLNHNRYPGSVNATIDYYDAGMLVAFDLDAALRLATPERTLDGEFRAFYDAFAGRGDGYTSQDICRFLSERTPAVEAILSREVETPGALATPLFLEALGFDVTFAAVRHLGLVLKDDAGPEIANVLDGSPAGRSGLAPGDLLQRVNGLSFQRKALAWQIANEPRVTVVVNRGSQTFTFEAAPADRRELTGLTWRGTEEQLERLRRWFGTPQLDLAPGQPVPLGAYDNFHGIQTIL